MSKRSGSERRKGQGEGRHSKVCLLTLGRLWELVTLVRIRGRGRWGKEPNPFPARALSSAGSPAAWQRMTQRVAD